MAWQVSVYTAPMFVAAAAAGIAIVAVARRRSAIGGRYPFALLGATGWWSLTYGLGLSWTGLFGKMVLYSLMYVGVALTPVAWVAFVSDYAGHSEWLTRRRLLLLLVLPAVTAGLALTNAPLGSHELLFVDPTINPGGALVTVTYDYGPWFWVHSAYSYLLLAVGIAVLVRLALVSETLVRLQTGSLLSAAVIPIAGNLINILGTTQWFDPTSLGLVLAALIMVASSYRYHFLDLVPAARQLARSELVTTTPDPVLVVDAHGSLLDLNPAAASLFDTERTGAVGRPLADLSPALAAVDLDANADRTHTDVAITDGPGRRYFDVEVAPLTESYGVVTGRLVSLREVTDRRRREQRLAVLNRLLRHNVRNTMTTVRGTAEFVGDRTDDDLIRDRMAAVERSVDAVVEKRDKFDWVLRTLDVDEQGPVDAAAAVARVVEDARSAYPDATIAFESDGSYWVDGESVLPVVVEELVENAVVHAGETPAVEVTVTADADTVDVVVADDGPGVPDHETAPIEAGTETALDHASGVGLWLVHWVVDALGGRVTFENDDGARVRVRLPRRDPPDGEA
jgi:PAS domain S-box-containing protein